MLVYPWYNWKTDEQKLETWKMTIESEIAKDPSTVLIVVIDKFWKPISPPYEMVFLGFAREQLGKRLFTIDVRTEFLEPNILRGLVQEKLKPILSEAVSIKYYGQHAFHCTNDMMHELVDTLKEELPKLKINVGRESVAKSVKFKGDSHAIANMIVSSRPEFFSDPIHFGLVPITEKALDEIFKTGISENLLPIKLFYRAIKSAKTPQDYRNNLQRLKQLLVSEGNKMKKAMPARAKWKLNELYEREKKRLRK